MGKLDELEHRMGANADDSLTRVPATTAHQDSVVAMPERLKGLVKSRNAAEIPVDRIIADPNQPREIFDEESINRLAESLKVRGVLQPLWVRWDEGQICYILIAGELRWRAAMKAGLASVPCVIHEGGLDPGELLALQLIENCLREDLQPIEQAKGYRKLMELRGWSAGQLAEELHLPKSTITRALELLDLPAPVQDLVDRGDLAPSAACEVGRLERTEDQVELAERVVAEKLTRAKVVEAVRAKKEGRAAPVRSAKTEIRLDNGYKITVTGENADDGPEVLVEILRQAVRKLQAEIRAAAKGQGQAA
jgi:ParB family transcriptional regulator, chromosome partitioning protein